ncbi:MAG: type 4a pilus biogenesis protein PilO [Candidatus Omnitrophica bacterium]|nr:type 4a pilus biogenesis protein PilO [Candidatus Omnitrophota bacterium]
MNKILENFQMQVLQLDKQKIMLVLVIFATLVYLDLAYLLGMQFNMIKQTGKKTVTIKGEIANLKREMVRIQQLKITQQTQAVKERKKLISQEEIVPLLSEISSLANKNNVKIIQMRPAMDTSGKQTVGSFFPVSISLELTSNYHSLGGFLDKLEQLDKFIAVESLSISRQGNDYFNERINVGLKTYVRQ